MIKNKRTTDKLKDHQLTGFQIEKQATDWLKNQGLVLLENNFHCRQGEIDIIMLDCEQLVFVEVRYRRNQQYGGAAASVDWRKQQKIRKTAAYFLTIHPIHHHRACRFDVLAAQPDCKNGKICWDWIDDAFCG